MDKRLAEIREKVANGIRLTKEDGLFLYEFPDLLSIGQIAKEKKKQLIGDYVFFNVNCHINLTNICVSKCKFCAFGVDENAPKPYAMTVEQAFDYASRAVDQGITEFHIVSALNPKLTLDYYVEIISRLKKAYPHILIQALTAVEIVYLANISHLSVEEVLCALKDAGLDAIPGGGAEILDDRIRKELCPRKASSEEWLEVHRIAHKLGIKTNCTMLFGHIENYEDRINHLLKLRELQDEAPGFKAFIPLPFLPENTALAHLNKTSVFDQLKTIAISRLILDNIEHIKAFWVMLGIPVAQIALEFGADDLDGTIIEEKIMHAAGAKTDKGISKTSIIRLIKEAGYIPAERDTVYNILQTY
ncbi:de-hypoxanthine futalosine cyclase [Thermosyntropha lipolytica DSM 11003]|uniref:Aminodeoxyfutalosine synthase n=1 Tax=Thermosyntropha lipolytica DSM 11003 TaxID=1123382 RepID=A0A1M5L9R1_9FIRM|nr:aminofutalosine synthase MqnE [Thermosyntropha lipolytica]SHG61842.1 de-hypoxanthine futalosine cyclase [Thermosyntropha lipolytica DSM 11003]